MEFNGKELTGKSDEQIAEMAIQAWKKDPDIRAEFRDLLRLHAYLNFCREKGVRDAK